MIPAYRDRCAISGLPTPQLLDAAHIIPDGDEEYGARIIPNGMALSKIHHAAFDGHMIGIDPDYRIRICERLLELHDGPSARSLVMVVEAWAKLPDASGHLDTETPPSQSPNRVEIVALMLEDHTRNATRMLPILRDAHGVFTNFGDPGPMLFGESAGRFSGLMPHNKPSVREAAQAKASLLALGMNIVNRGFDPSLN